MLDLYSYFLIECQNDIKDKDIYRQKLRHFLLFSKYYDHERAQKKFASTSENDFHIEELLVRANVCVILFGFHNN